ncbi:MAG: prepilin-type N-terminal cleavage/methylation domain-containing protein [Burkholderiales bacterium]|nr:prepilin-type N-terminal cleavage/methylation domain-containing protein [Burkholderiales bacterium]
MIERRSVRAPVRRRAPPGAGAACAAAPGTAGFTLIEMAVAVFVIAILLGSILVPLTAQVEQRRIADTQRILDEARDALIGFALVNGRLPRPAVSASNGAERAACATEADCTGFIPWAVLGTARLDAWGKMVRYSVTPAYANAAFSLTTPGTKTIRTRLPPAFGLSDLVTAVPAVVFSHGQNNHGTSEAGTALPDNSGTNVDEDANAAATTTFIHRTQVTNTGATGGEFDDQVSWVPVTILANRMIAAGRLP